MSRDFLIWHFSFKVQNIIWKLNEFIFLWFLPFNHLRISALLPLTASIATSESAAKFTPTQVDIEATQTSDWISANYFILGQATIIALLKSSVSSQGSGEQTNHQKLFDLSNSLPFPALSSHSSTPLFFPLYFPHRLLFLWFSSVVKLTSKNHQWFWLGL